MFTKAKPGDSYAVRQAQVNIRFDPTNWSSNLPDQL